MPVMLSDDELRDLRDVLAAAMLSLRFHPKDARTVERLQFWLDNLRTPEQVARVEAMKQRLALSKQGQSGG